MTLSSPRLVVANQIVSPALPPVHISIDPSLTYVGGPRFELYGIALAEQHLFVRANAEHTIEHLVWVQFEGFLPDNQRTYRYPVTETVTLAGTAFIYDASSVAIEDAIAERPDSDLAAVRDHLRAQGYEMPGKVWAQRFVYLIEPDNRHELMIIYGEFSEVAQGSQPMTTKERALHSFSVQFF
jgi:hypothetical protein